MIAGYLSLMPPTILGLMGLMSVVQAGILAYVGPIPIQFLVGYAFVRFSHKLKPATDSDQEWIKENEKEEKSWWESQNEKENTQHVSNAYVFRSRVELIVANLRKHPIRSMIIIGLFIVYLPFIYQIHLNMVAVKVSVSEGLYLWRVTGCYLGPIPFDYAWFGVVPSTAYVRLTPVEVFFYSYFIPSLFARVMWSVMWFTIGILYIISPLLKFRKKIEK
jgi:hypothetical protein